MPLHDIFSKWFEKKIASRIYYNRVEDGFIVEPSITSRDFEADKGYFEIRLSECYLRNRSELLSRYIPVVLSVCEFDYSGKRHAVPFFVDIRKILEPLSIPIRGDALELQNTRIVGPIPYLGGDVGLFVGLFRAATVDYLSGVFDLLGRLFKAFDATQLTTYLQVSEILVEGLKDMMGLKDVEPYFGIGDQFVAQRSPKRFRSGFLTYINAPERELAATNFWVKGGRLYEGDKEKPVKPYDHYDYCLVSIEHLEQRRDLATLPFHKLWQEAQAMVWKEGQIDKARTYGLPALAQAISGSPDLIPDDQSIALQLYKANFEREVERYLSIRGPSTETGTKGARGGITSVSRGKAVISELGAKPMLQKAASIAEKSLKDKNIKAAFLNLADHFESVLGPMKGEDMFDLSNETIAQQLDNLRKTQVSFPDPKRLAEVIIRDAIHTFGGRLK
jgi:hypothetical protein